MLKESVKINTTNGYITYGTIEKPKRSTDKLVIFVHGLLSNQNHPAFLKASPYFKKENYAVLKFDFYSQKESARSFSNTTMREQADDLENIINYYKKNFKDISVVAHSLGGIVSLLTKTDNIKKIILWEPSIEPKNVFSSSKKIDDNHYLFCENKIQKKVIDELSTIPSLAKLIKNNKKPISIITAKNFGDKHGLNLYFKNLEEPKYKKGFYVIKNTDHNFNKNTNKLIKRTIKLIKNNQKEKPSRYQNGFITTKLMNFYKRINHSISDFQSS